MSAKMNQKKKSQQTKKGVQTPQPGNKSKKGGYVVKSEPPPKRKKLEQEIDEELSDDDFDDGLDEIRKTTNKKSPKSNLKREMLKKSSDDEEDDEVSDESEEADDDDDSGQEEEDSDAEGDDSDEDDDDSGNDDSDGDDEPKNKKAKIGKSEKKTPGNKSTPLPKVSEEELAKDIISKAERDARTLFVKNVKLSVDDAKLRTLSKDIVEVRMKQCRGQNDRDKNFAFIEFKDEQTAEKNFKMLKGKSLEGLELVVDYVGAKSIAKPQKPAEVTAVDPLKLYVTGFGKNATEEEIKKLFPKASSVTLPTFKKDQKPKEYAFIHFTDANLCKQTHSSMQDSTHQGRKLVVAYARAPDRALRRTKKKVALNKKKAEKRKSKKAEKKDDSKTKESESDDDDDVGSDEEMEDDDDDSGDDSDE